MSDTLVLAGLTIHENERRSSMLDRIDRMRIQDEEQVVNEHDELGFEDALGFLERRVRSLESAGVPLDEALTLLEEGVSPARTCHGHLEAAEKRAAALSRVVTGIEESPFGDE